MTSLPEVGNSFGICTIGQGYCVTSTWQGAASGLLQLICPFREYNGRLSRLFCDEWSVLAGEELTGLQLMGWTQGILLQNNSGGCLRVLQPYNAAGERHLAKLTGEVHGFRLCLIFFELLRNFLHWNTDSYRGRAGNDAVDLIFRDLATCCFFSHVESLIASLLILVGIGTVRKAVISWSFTKGILIYLATY